MLSSEVAWFFIFFFQAEDGIRDVAVTGVQTCALPILDPRIILGAGPQEQQPSRLPGVAAVDSDDRPAAAAGHRPQRDLGIRSEERRVGKSVDLGGRRIIKKKKNKRIKRRRALKIERTQ